MYNTTQDFLPIFLTMLGCPYRAVQYVCGHTLPSNSFGYSVRLSVALRDCSAGGAGCILQQTHGGVYFKDLFFKGTL